MTNSIRAVMSPLLIISYIFGLRIIEFPAGHQKIWFGLSYILLLWTIYNFLLVHYCTAILFYIRVNSDLFITFRGLSVFTALLSTICGTYYDKKFKNCMKKLAIVDSTLEKLGIMTNYQQLYRRVVWIVLGWTIIAILINSVNAVIFIQQYHLKAATAFYITFILNYCYHINLIEDLTMMSIIGYIGIKFEQINKQLQNMANNKRGIKRAWENAVLHLPQCKVSKTPSSKWMIRILIHLHLELRKISREVDGIFGIQTTFKMGSYFAFMSEDLINLFRLICIKNYITSYKVLYVSGVLLWLFHNMLKLLIINYICEKVSTQANSTRHFINEISFSICDVEMCENVSQLLLHIEQSPLRFCGIGLFQFGHKFINGFIKSVGTVVVILIQMHGNK